MSKPQPPRKPAAKPAAKPSTGKVSRQPIDPLLLQRLEELGQRRPAGAPLPPPSPASANRPAARPAAGTASGARPAPGSQEAKLAAAAERAAAARAAKAGGPGVKTAAKPGRKVKPARASKIASVAVSAATTLALAGLFARQDNGTTDSVVLTAGTDPTAATTATTAPTADTSATTAAGTGAPAASTTVATTATTAAPAANTIADGTYVGAASQNRFGTVQVQAVYSGGQLTDVQILSYPDGDRRSLRISQVAIPSLIDQSIQAGGASISGVSGATYTSRSYVASLQSAIDAAKQASGVTG